MLTCSPFAFRLSPLTPPQVHVRTAGMQELANYGIAADGWALKPMPAAGDAAANGAAVGGTGRPQQRLPRASRTAAAPRTAAAVAPPWDSATTAYIAQCAMQAVRCHNGAAPFDAAAVRDAAAREGRDSFTQLMVERYTGSGASANGSGASSRGDGSASANGAAARNSASHGSAAAPPDAALAREADWGLGRRLGSKLGRAALERRVNWLNSIREWQAEFLGTVTAQEFVQCIREDLLSQTVFVFTPLGDIMRLPLGATAVDFAYHVHSEVGNSMVAAKVNGRPVHPSYALCNADVVEVLQYAAAGRPQRLHAMQRHRSWLAFAKTRSARYKLGKWLKEEGAALAAEGGGAPESGAPPPECSTWLVVECTDRAGLLAEVATEIHAHGLNVQVHKGFACR